MVATEPSNQSKISTKNKSRLPREFIVYRCNVGRNHLQYSTAVSVINVQTKLNNSAKRMDDSVGLGPVAEHKKKFTEDKSYKVYTVMYTGEPQHSWGLRSTKCPRVLNLRMLTQLTYVIKGVMFSGHE